MTVDQTPSMRPGRPATHAIRVIAMATVAAVTIAACSSGATDEPAAASTQEPNASTTPPPTTPAPTTTPIDVTSSAIASTTLPPPATPVEATNVTIESKKGAGSVGGVSFAFSVPDGWDNEGWGAIQGDPAYGVFFMEAGNTFTDPCHAVALDPPVGPTVDDLAAVWADLPVLNATVPTQITVDGFAGKLVEFTVPDFDRGASADDCAGGGHFMLLEDVDTPGDGYWAQGPNQHNQLRIIDVDGTRLVIGAMWFPDTPAEDRADIDEILASIEIG